MSVLLIPRPYIPFYNKHFAMPCYYLDMESLVMGPAYFIFNDQYMSPTVTYREIQYNLYFTYKLRLSALSAQE